MPTMPLGGSWITGEEGQSGWERMKGAAKGTPGNIRGAGEGLYNLATGKESAKEVAQGTAEATVDAATGGEADEWWNEYQEQEGESLDQELDQFDKELEYGNDGGGDIYLPGPGENNLRVDGDTVSTLASANTAARIGIDAVVDNPRGPNVQDAGAAVAKGVTQEETKAGAAEDISVAEQTFNDNVTRGSELLLKGYGLEDNETAQTAASWTGTGFELLLGDVAEGTVTAATGIDPETGEEEASAEPLDLIDVATLGVSKGVSGAAKLGKAAKGGRAAASSADVAKAGSGATAVAKGAETAESASIMGKLSGLLDTVRRGGKAADGTASGGDDVADVTFDTAPNNYGVSSALPDSTPDVADVTFGASDDAVDSSALTGGTAGLESVDEFDGLASDVGLSDDAADQMEDLRDTQGVLDEGRQAGATPGGSETTITGMEDFATSVQDTVSGAADDVASGTSAGFRNLFGDAGTSAGDDAAVSAARGGDGATDDLAANIGQTAEQFRTAFDGAGDDVAAGADDAADAATSGSSGGMLSWLPSPGLKTIFAGGLGAGILGLFGLGGLGLSSPPSETRDPGSGGQTRVRATPRKTYLGGPVLFEIERGDDERGWDERGFAIMLGPGEGGILGPSGTQLVLTKDGRPTPISPITGSGDNTVPSPRFSTVGEADDAMDAFREWLEQQKQGGDDNTPKDPGKAQGLDGSLEAPDSIRQGEGFEANWSVKLTGGERMSRVLTLAIATPDSLVPLTETPFSVTTGRRSESGTFSVQSGWGTVAPGDYTLHAVVAQNGNAQGSVAKTTITVAEADAGDKSKEGSSWGDAEMVRELPMGWYLFAQTKEDGSGETRYMVVGKREDGTRIYLDSEGRARQSPDFFPTVKAAAAAFQKWAKRAQNGNLNDGERPSQKSGRPSSSGVKKDAGAKDEKSVQGIAGRLRSAASENPVLFAGGAALVIGAGYYLYQNGYLDYDFGGL